MRTNRVRLLIVTGILVGCAIPARAQREITVEFSDPSRPGEVNAQIMDGNVTVRGYDGDAVVVLVDTDEAPAEGAPERAQGLRRILSNSGFTAIEDNNVISIRSGWDDGADLVIQVPYPTSLTLDVLDGDVEVTGVRGEIELNATDGDITLNDVSGPVLANAVDGDIEATLIGLPSDRPTSFGAVDGDIDVTLPSDARATMTMRALDGEIFTDFDIDLSGPGRPADGQPRRRENRTLTGAINGGGVEVSLQTVEGDIFLRRGN